MEAGEKVNNQKTEDLTSDQLKALLDSIEKDIRPTTVTIYPDELKKDFKNLDLLIPRLTPSHSVVPVLEGLTFQEVEEAFAQFKKLPLGSATSQEIAYEGRQLITGELVEHEGDAPFAGKRLHRSFLLQRGT